MGYLDKTSVTVDAVLTKTGRTKLASGHGINIKYFCVSDRGIDYRLYNPDHANGSDYYDEAIVNLPNIEATPSATHYLTDKLVTFGRHSTQLPIIVDVDDLYACGAIIHDRTITPKIHPTGGTGGNFTMVVSDPTLLNVVGSNSQVHDYNRLLQVHLGVQDMDNPGAWVGTDFVISPAAVNENHTIHAVVVHNQSGLYKTFTITMSDNEVVKRRQITNNPTV